MSNITTETMSNTLYQFTPEQEEKIERFRKEQEDAIAKLAEELELPLDRVRMRVRYAPTNTGDYVDSKRELMRVAPSGWNLHVSRLRGTKRTAPEDGRDDNEEGMPVLKF